VALSHGAKQRAPAITTARDEVQMALPVPAFETVLQGTIKPRAPFAEKRKECGTPNFSSKAMAKKGK
jgi:hypothetical protein